MRKKKVFAGVLASVLVLGSLTLPKNISFGGFDFGTLFAQAAEIVDSGNCGGIAWTDDGLTYTNDLTWTLDDEGALTISGSGEMALFVGTAAPHWYDFHESIKSVMIEDGASNICEYAFVDCSSLTSIEIPNSVTSIDKGAFLGCSSLTDVYYAGSEDDCNNININYDWGENDIFLDVTIHYTKGSSEYSIGDVNQDSSVDYLDAMLVLRYDAELDTLTDEQLALADVNGDGSVDSLDAILILRYDSGLIDEF